MTSLLEAVPIDAVGYIVSFIFRDMYNKEPVFVDGGLLVSYIHLTRTCKTFERLVKDNIDRYITDWQQLCARMRYRSDSPLMVKPDEECLAMMRGGIYYTANIDMHHKAIESFRKRHSIEYHTKKTGKLYKGYIGIKKLRAIKVAKPLKTDYKALLDRYDYLKSKRKQLHKGIDTRVGELIRKFITENPGKVTFGLFFRLHTP